MNKLTIKQQQRLQKYIDGESSTICKFFTKRLIERNEEAKEFVDSMLNLSLGIKQSQIKPRVNSDELWNKISLRLDQEEKARFYLGERRSGAVEKSGFKNLFVNPYFTGASVALASFFLGIIIKSQAVPNVTDVASSTIKRYSDFSSNIPSLQSVNYGNSRPTTRAISPEIDIDWVKSDGHVRLLSSPNGANNIIWVKRRSAPIYIRKKPIKNPGGVKIIEEQIPTLSRGNK